MKKGLFFLIVIAFIAGCRKDKDSGSGLKLREIKADNEIYSSFEYNDGRLVKENRFFSFCTNPVDEYEYVYQSGRLSQVKTTMRSFYSSITTICNPAAGIRADHNYQYDVQGRISRVSNPQTYIDFEYNSNGQVTRQIFYDDNNLPYDTIDLTYDIRGNIIMEAHIGGPVNTYEYDNKTNPFYKMKQNPMWISGYNASPNNVIKAVANGYTYERNIIAYTDNMPYKINENGVIYTYVYE
jgi:YD repeat-containing protein